MRAPTETEPSIAALLQWLGQAGARLTHLEVASVGGAERGLRALAELAPNEALARIPRRCVLTVEDARASELGRLLEAHAQFDDERTYLLAFLLQEKERGEGSSWKPFLDVLPRSFPTHPFFFDRHESALLNGSFAQGMVEYQRANLADRHARLCQQVPGFSRFTLEQFVWAHFAVVSRTFSVPRGGGSTTCMVPLADMLNDGRPWNTRWALSADGQFFELHTAGAVAAGEELVTSYGARGNLHLLVQYGFVHEDNVHDEVLMVFGLTVEDVHTEEKQRLLGLSRPGEPRSYRLQRPFEAQALAESLSFLRVAHAEVEELAMLSGAPDALARAKSRLSTENERRAVAAFVAACQERLAGYETSLAEDERLLREGALTRNARNCVLLRRGEKQILQSYVEACAGLP